MIPCLLIAVFFGVTSYLCFAREEWFLFVVFAGFAALMLSCGLAES